VSSRNDAARERGDKPPVGLRCRPANADWPTRLQGAVHFAHNKVQDRFRSMLTGRRPDN